MAQIKMNIQTVKCFYCNGECKIKYKSLEHPDWTNMKNIDMYKCVKCKSLITYPMPSKEKLAACYQEYVKGFPDYKSKAKETSKQDKWYEIVVKMLKVKSLENKKIADVGAGEGLFDKKLLEICRNCSIDCFDYHSTPEILKKVRNEKGNKLSWFTIDSMSSGWQKDETYDIVMCNALLEHVTNPRKLMESLHRICKKNGLIIVMAPCVNSIVYRLMGEKWIYIIPGEHLTIPSFTGLRELLKNFSDCKIELRKLSPVYSTKYLFDSLFKTNLPKFLDFMVPVPTGSFFLKIRK